MAFHKPQSLPSLLLGLVASLVATAALAQYPQGGSTGSGSSSDSTPDSTQGAGQGSPGGSGTGSGMGQGMGPGMMGSGPGSMQRWGDGITPGWSLMTPAERMEHQLRMRSMTTYDECKTYMAQHQAQMDARAGQQGTTATVQPRMDVCEGMPR